MSSYVISEAVSAWTLLTLIVWGKESWPGFPFKFFMCFHKNEFVLFSAVDFENNSFLALRINAVVLFRQFYTDPIFYVCDMHLGFYLQT